MEQLTSVGNWKRLRILGAGTFGIVSLWSNKRTGERLAIKVCKSQLGNRLTPRQRERWQQEVEMMKKIKNENIVGYREIPALLKKVLMESSIKDVPILSMEYCKFGSLRDMLSKPENCCGIQEWQVICVLKDTSNALKYLHNWNITHRDFKPENIVLQLHHERKSKIIYKLIDLGYAKELANDTLSFVGTLQYLAPEIFEKKTYKKNVDYWSFGITAFEVICGVRPFLPNYSTVKSFEQVKKKSSNVICIQTTHTGDIKQLKELLPETSLNMPLKGKIEKWLRLMLQYEPEKRGVSNNANVDVFDRLNEIISKKFIRVFSVYTYEFLTYEINASTLMSTLQDWIARDVKYSKIDQLLIPVTIVESDYVLDYCMEDSSTPALFVFKKNNGLNENVLPNLNLPELIRVLFNSYETEFKFGTLRILNAQVVYFVDRELKHVNALTNGICCLCDYLQFLSKEEKKLHIDVQTVIKNILTLVEFYNKLEQLLNMKKYKNVKSNNIRLCECLLEYEICMHQLQEVIMLQKKISKRHQKLVIKANQFSCACNLEIEQLRKVNCNTLSQEAVKCYEDIVETDLIRNLKGSQEILNIISSTIKIRNDIFNNDTMRSMLKIGTKYWKELDKLISGLHKLKDKFVILREKISSNIIKRSEILLDEGIDLVTPANIETIIRDNVLLRYNMQDFIEIGIIRYKNLLDINVEDVEIGLGSTDQSIPDSSKNSLDINMIDVENGLGNTAQSIPKFFIKTLDSNRKDVENGLGNTAQSIPKFFVKTLDINRKDVEHGLGNTAQFIPEFFKNTLDINMKDVENGLGNTAQSIPKFFVKTLDINRKDVEHGLGNTAQFIPEFFKNTLDINMKDVEHGLGNTAQSIPEFFKNTLDINMKDVEHGLGNTAQSIPEFFKNTLDINMKDVEHGLGNTAQSIPEFFKNTLDINMRDVEHGLGNTARSIPEFLKNSLDIIMKDV